MDRAAKAPTVGDAKQAPACTGCGKRFSYVINGKCLECTPPFKRFMFLGNALVEIK